MSKKREIVKIMNQIEKKFESDSTESLIDRIGYLSMLQKQIENLCSESWAELESVMDDLKKSELESDDFVARIQISAPRMMVTKEGMADMLIKEFAMKKPSAMSLIDNFRVPSKPSKSKKIIDKQHLKQ